MEKDIKRLDRILHELRTGRLLMKDAAAKKDLNSVIEAVVNIRLTLAKKLGDAVYAETVDI